MDEVEVFPSVGSTGGGPLVYVRFFNLTQWPVDIIWMRAAEKPTKYATLKIKQWIDIRTYEGHPWIFRRSIDGAPLVVNQEQIFWPKLVARNCIIRNCMYITNPMMSLTELAARRLLLPGSTLKREIFETLPQPVKKLLVTIKTQKRAYLSSSVVFPLPLVPPRTPAEPPVIPYQQ